MAAPRAIPPLLKRLNERTVLETIREGAPISRAEIARRAGISKPTVSLALLALLEAGLVREAPPAPAGPTYGAVFFEPVPEAALVLGLDLGARFLRAALCDLRGTIRARQDVELRSIGKGEADADAVLASVAGLRESLVGAAGLEGVPIDGVVVGVPGAVEPDLDRVHLSENVAGLEGRRFGSELSETLGLPVTVWNDINLAALGERWRGAAHGVDDFVFLSIGTGLGAGLVLRGELHRGAHGAAGELDYAAAGLDRDVDPCAAALSAVAERLATAPGAKTTLAPPYDGRAIFAAARAGDAVARAAVEEEARRIALHIVPVAAVTDVGLVVLGGGVGANPELLDEIRPLLAEWLPYPPRVEISSLGDAAVLNGALAVGLRFALDNVFVNRPAAPAGA
ncbi:MAG TPA: ROK family transcriptional regulator [Gaiellaceae bacterium]|nr:ROK family transcriptional regulator [Gaiellaceae bacterium]